MFNKRLFEEEDGADVEKNQKKGRKSNKSIVSIERLKKARTNHAYKDFAAFLIEKRRMMETCIFFLYRKKTKFRVLKLLFFFLVYSSQLKFETEQQTTKSTYWTTFFRSDFFKSWKALGKKARTKASYRLVELNCIIFFNSCIETVTTKSCSLVKTICVQVPSKTPLPKSQQQKRSLP